MSARLAREEGFGIIEVMVSALVVALAAVGTFAALDSATATSGQNKARSVAASIAQADQERLRAMSPSAIAALAPTSSKTVDRKVFTIASGAQWVSERSGTASCSSADGKTDYLRITSSVTWPGMGGIAPVKVESLRAVPKGAFRPNQGSLAIRIVDRSGNGVPGVAVSATGPATYSATTNALGCVIIDQAPIGTYTIGVNKSGYVADKLPGGQALTEQTVVAKQQTSTTTITYDLAGTAAVDFKTTASVGSNATADAVGQSFSLGHTGLGFPNVRSFAAAAPTSALSSGSPHTLFPFSSGYALWAGSCPEANPQLYGVAPAAAIVPPGGSIGPVAVRKPLLSVTVMKYTSSNERSNKVTDVSGARVVIAHVIPGCARTITLATNANGVATTPMPFGDYTICAQEGTGSNPARRTITTRQNRVASGVEYDRAYNGSSTPPSDAAVMLSYDADYPGQCTP